MVQLYNARMTVTRTALTLYTLFLAYRYLVPYGSGSGRSQVIGWVLHVGAFLVLGVLVAWSFPNRFSDSRLRYIVAIIGFGLVLEVLQAFIPSRTFSVVDILMNTVGVGLVWFEPVIRQQIIGTNEEDGGEEEDIEPEDVHVGKVRPELRMPGGEPGQQQRPQESPQGEGQQ